MINPLTGTLPHLITLYKRDLSYLPEEELRWLEIPLKVACSFCAKYPAFWEYVMDFIQEGNVQLVKALAIRDPDWTEAEFAGYVGKSAKGAILSYVGRTRSVYISESIHWRTKQRGDARELERMGNVGHHFSFEALYDEMLLIPDQTNMQQAFIAAKREQIESLLAQLSSKEQIAIKLYYGIDGSPQNRTEIGKVIHLTPKHAIRLINTAIKRLNNEQQPSFEIRAKDRDERMQTAYQQWLEQGKQFQVKEFARTVKCGDHIAHEFLKERGAISTRPRST